MAGFDNDVLYGINADYSNALSGTGASTAGQLLGNGQLWIGSIIPNGGGTHINVGKITSTTLTVGYSSPDITIESAGGLAATNFDVQANTAPGTDPVVPTAAGVVTVNGSAVANHSVVLETRSRAANAFNLEVQYAAAAASTDATKSGVAHFNSAQFTADANGFVSATGTIPIQTTENSGTATPSAGNLNIFGTNSALTGYSPWTTGSGSTATINMPGTVKWVVNATANLGTHTTIQAAITAAAAGDTVFITAKSTAYVENLTFKPGVNLSAFPSDSSQNGTGNVIISGTCTLTTAGTVTMTGIQLQTNSAALLAVTGTLASVVNLDNCYLNCTNNTGITFSSSNAAARINIYNCKGDIGTTSISLFSHSSAGTMNFQNCNVSNSGGTSTASTVSAGACNLLYSLLFFPITTSGTSTFSSLWSDIDSSPQNATALTLGGSGNGNFIHSSCNGGSASAISIGAVLNVTNSQVVSSNTNAIAGAGTLNLAQALFTGTSSGISTSTVASFYTNLGKWKASGQPAFLAYLPSTELNKTGNGTTFTLGSVTALTEVFDQGSDFNTNGTFTAPVTGRYMLAMGCYLTGCTINTITILTLAASNRSFQERFGHPPTSTDNGGSISALVDMDAGDVCTATVIGFGEAADTDDVVGSSSALSYFSGFLAC